jgi:hypothetical protein
LCSRIATGGLSAEALAGFHDENGTSFKDAATSAGFKAASYQACDQCFVNLPNIHISIIQH